MTTRPGFSSRISTSTIRQLRQRDEVAMSLQPEPGFSNSKPADNAPEDVHPDVTADPSIEPGATNAKVIDSDRVEDKAVRKTTKSKK